MKTVPGAGNERARATGHRRSRRETRHTQRAAHAAHDHGERTKAAIAHTHADARAKAASSYFGLHALFLRLRLSIALV